eukprot:4065291-Amphidinium_carterae.1
MVRAGCAQNEINRAYEFYKKGPQGYDQTTTIQQVQQALHEEKGDDDAQSTYGDSSIISSTHTSEHKVSSEGRGKQLRKRRSATRRMSTD